MRYSLPLILVLLLACLTVAAGDGPEIVDRPAPGYTDAARQEKVEGWVRLRVTFNADGTIGDAVFVAESSKKKKLSKSGLVDQAIAAAKKIGFRPARDADGRPVTVTKLVEYTFTPY